MLRLTLSTALCLVLANVAFANQRISLECSDAGSLSEQLGRLGELRKSGNDDPVIIELGDGTYRLQQTIKLSETEIGRGLTLQAKNPGQAILTGGRPLAAGRLDEQGNWRIKLPADWNRFGRPRTLVIDGKLSSAARHPNTGYLRIERALPDRRSGFIASAGDIPDVTGEFDLVLLHDWSSSRLPVASYDPETRTLRTIGPIGCQADHYAIDHFEKQPRYWLEGHQAFADAAGEWFIDAAADEIVVVAGDRQQQCPTVVLPWLDQLLIASGTEEPIRNFVIAGITFTETRFTMPAGGYASAQATMHEPRDQQGARTTDDRPFVDAAVKIDHAVGCRLTNCDFQALGGSGLWIGGRTQNCKVFRSRFSDIGGNGLNLGEDNSRRVDGRSWHQSAPQQVPTENQVHQCEFSQCGKILPGAVAIWAALHRKLEIADNHLHDCPYTGISLGWLWNDSPSPAAKNVIRDNRIEFVMQVLSDGGGIYTLGRQPGSLITGNSISDVPLNAGRAESNGMFLDEGTTGLTIRDNTIRRVDKSPLRFHKAGENIVRDNYWELASAETPPVRFNNTPENNITIEANEVLAAQKSYFLIGNSLTWDTIPSQLDGNVQWHIDCGKNLAYIRENYQAPCVSTSRLWPTALTTTQYDYVSIQPHYGTTIEADVEVISYWMKLQPKAIFVIHTGWARHAEWIAEASDDDPAGTLTHSDAYFSELLRVLRQQHPGREIRRTLAMDHLHRIAKDIETGAAPIHSIDELYRDAIHMKIPAGRYLMHNTMRQALDQPLNEKGFEKMDADLKQYLDSLLVTSRARQ